MNALGSRLMILRGLAGGISQRDLARLADISPAYPGLIERSDDEPEISGQIALRIAHAFGCSVEFVLTGAGDPPNEAEVREAAARAKVEADARESAKRQTGTG